MLPPQKNDPGQQYATTQDNYSCTKDMMAEEEEHSMIKDMEPKKEEDQEFWTEEDLDQDKADPLPQKVQQVSPFTDHCPCPTPS